MQFFQETTVWNSENVPNHIYLLNDSKSKMIGYVRAGTKKLVIFSKPMGFDVRGRKFKRVENTFGKLPTQEKPAYPTWIVSGSKGDSYTVSLIDGRYSCTCTGFKFHGRCKHATQIENQQ